MKKIIFIVTCLFAILMSSCASSKEEGYIDLKSLYKDNMENAMVYYDQVFSECIDCGIEKIKKNEIVHLNNQEALYDCKYMINIKYGQTVMCVAYQF